jgi:hypothetical protein
MSVAPFLYEMHNSLETITQEGTKSQPKMGIAREPDGVLS